MNGLLSKSLLAVSLVSAVFGSGWGEAAWAADLGTEQQRASGKVLYDKYCAHCHGLTGAAEAPSALYYKPVPRDFTKGKYKVRSTLTGELPTDEDIKRAIKVGFAYELGHGAYTTMPPWPRFTDPQLMELVYYLKSFAPVFADPEYNKPKLATLPPAPALSDESITRGRAVYEANECIKCHGVVGRGDGNSAPTMKDDWGRHIRPADLTKRWTFRGGGSREDIFRTITTGFNGTPMPAYGDTVSEADRWDLVNYVFSLSRGSRPDYNKPDKPIVVYPVADPLEFSDVASAKSLFAAASPGIIPIAGQVVELGREFNPSINELEVSAVYTQDDVAIMLRWNDMSSDVTAENSPSLAVEEQLPTVPAAEAEPDADADPFADEEAAAAPVSDDPFADEESGQEAASGSTTKFSDAVAIQLPTVAPEGFHLPYFIFGNSANSVDLWFSDLAKPMQPKFFLGKGSKSLTEKSDAGLTSVAEYVDGQWTVVFKRKRAPEGSMAFDQGTLVPVAFSVWDGFNEERGAKRGLTSWYSFYVEPAEKPSILGPILAYAGGLFLLELLIIWYVRRNSA